MAGTHVSVSISPPVFVFPAPPEVVVIPQTYVYYDPDVDFDIFFCGGHWYRPQGGYWYGSASYNGTLGSHTEPTVCPAQSASKLQGHHNGGKTYSLMANWTGIGKLGKEEITGHPMAGEDGGTKLTTDTMDPMEAVDTMEVMVTMGALDPMEAVDTTEAEDLTEDPMEGCRY